MGSEPVDTSVLALFEVTLVDGADHSALDDYARYKAAVPALIARHGGTYLARAAIPETLEGDPGQGDRRWHVIRFPSAEAARAFWSDPDYVALAPLRAAAASVRAVVLTG